MRSKQKFSHTTSRKGYARLENEMKQESGSSNSISRVDLWIKGHLRKDNTPLNEEIGETVQKLRECSQESQTTTSIRDDALTRVLGREHQGRVRGLGFGATISMIDAHGSCHEREKKNEVKMAQMEKRFESLQSEMQQLKSMLSQFPSNARPSNTPNIEPSEDVVGCDCEILHWSGTGEVVGAGEVDSTDPNAQVDGNLTVGEGWWKIWVSYVYNSDMLLYRASPHGFYLKRFYWKYSFMA